MSTFALLAMFGLGPLELVVIVVAILLIVGTKIPLPPMRR